MENPFVVRGHDDIGKRFGFFALFDDALNEGFARDEGEGLAGETCGSVPRRNNAKNIHGFTLSHSLTARSKLRREMNYRGKGSTSATSLIANILTLNTIRYKWPTIRYIVDGQELKAQH